MNNFDISQEEVLSIFEEMIVPQMTNGISQQEVKQAFLLGGQPGSGKSAFARELIKVNKNIVFINGDDLRAYHPKYYFYLKDNDVEAADMTQTVCNFWVESLIQECVNRGLDFRYKELKKLGQPARFTKKESHDEAFRNIEGTLLELINSDLFKRFYIYQRFTTELKESIFEVGQKNEVLECFKEGRMSTECNQELSKFK